MHILEGIIETVDQVGDVGLVVVPVAGRGGGGKEGGEVLEEGGDGEAVGYCGGDFGGGGGGGGGRGQEFVEAGGDVVGGFGDGEEVVGGFVVVYIHSLFSPFFSFLSVGGFRLWL